MIDFKKYADGLVPAIVQDRRTQKVLMLGFMNEEALNRTGGRGKVTFYSRSKKRLWTKGRGKRKFPAAEESLAADCDADTLVIQVRPIGPGMPLRAQIPAGMK